MKLADKYLSIIKEASGIKDSKILPLLSKAAKKFNGEVVMIAGDIGRKLPAIKITGSIEDGNKVILQAEKDFGLQLGVLKSDGKNGPHFLSDIRSK